MKIYEKHHLKYKTIIGIDEVGRGAWAGPIVVAAVVLPKDYFNKAIKDSKQLSMKKRKMLFKEIIEIAESYFIVFRSSKEVDQDNPKGSVVVAINEILKYFKTKTNDNYFALIDGNDFKQTNYKYENIVKGDQKYLSIAAASILAKVIRDEYMEELHKKYSLYFFHQNKGYGTANHLLALRKQGPCKYHRFSYKPIKNLQKED